jgi:predicted O-methyltransferase YrrM
MSSIKINTEKVELDSVEFENTVNEIVKKYKIKRIVETGTYLGTGSTMIFAKTDLPVISMECVLDNVKAARKNLAAYPNVTVHHALSLDETTMYDAIVEASERYYPPDLRHDSINFVTTYLCEIDHKVEWVDFLKTQIQEPPQLVFLDSAGGLGLAEAHVVIRECLSTDTVLMFDDIDHVKHYYTGKLLEKLGLTPNVSSDGRFAWCHLLMREEC